MKSLADLTNEPIKTINITDTVQMHILVESDAVVLKWELSEKYTDNLKFESHTNNSIQKRDRSRSDSHKLWPEVPGVNISFHKFHWRVVTEGQNGDYLDNIKHFIVWLCNMKQLNFRHFNTNSEKFFETGNFFQKEAKSAPKRPILFCSVYQGVLGHFATIDHLVRGHV